MKNVVRTPTEFELFTKKYFEGELKRSTGKRIVVKHLEKLTSPDGTSYNIDLNFQLKIAGAMYRTIIECKYWKSLVTRAKVNEFKAVISDLRVHKGIIVTSKGFQSGAVKFAKKHGIALYKLTEKEVEIMNHFDGGLNTIQEKLIENSPIEFLNTKVDKAYTGMFYPAEFSIWAFIITKYGKEFAHFLLEVYSDKFDLDNGTVPEKFKPILKSMKFDWYKEYELIETGGLRGKLENEQEVRHLCLIINLLTIMRSDLRRLAPRKAIQNRKRAQIKRFNQ